MNILLDDKYREYAKPIVQMFHQQIPDMMKRKIERANVQQAWMYENVIMHSHDDSHILCVGSYEDTAFEMIKRHRANVLGIDPVLNMDLHTLAKTSNEKYDIVFATSVIEHVVDDEQFIADMCYLLKPNGMGLFTCDYHNDYPSVPKPVVDERLYTNNDLTARLPSIMRQHNCIVHGKCDYSGDIDFVYDGCNYAFATMIFRKEP